MVFIKTLGVKNFRSFGAGTGGAGETMTFRSPIAYLLGENNAGKSNVLAALRLAPIMAIGNPLSASDFYLRNTNLEVRFSMSVDFDGTDLSAMQQSITPSIGESENRSLSFLHTFVPSIEFEATHFKARRSTVWKSPFLHFAGSSVFSMTNQTNRLESPIAYDEFLKNMTPGNTSIDSQIAAFRRQPGKSGLQLPFDLSNLIGTYLAQRIAVFDEIRFRPRGTGQSTTESFNGERVADVLFTLKNGGKEHRERYELIKQKFASIFRGLELEITGSSQSIPEITVTRARDGFEVDITRTGAGTGQVITLLTHMVGKTGHVFAIDTPESHLHPHALRTLRSFLEETSQKNQLVIATHSPLVPTRNRIGSSIVVRDEKGKSTICQPSPKEFSDEDLSKLESRMSSETMDMLFARKAVFLEGETDVGAIPILARAIPVDLDREGISLVGLRGKHFALVAKMAQSLGIPYVVACDSDALMSIESVIRIGDQDLRTCAVMHELNSLGVLSGGDLRHLRKSAPARASSKRYPQRHFGRLCKIAERHKVFVWDTDIEGVLTSALSKKEVEAVYAAHKNKVVRGRFLAQAIVAGGALPDKLRSRLKVILRAPP